MNERIGDVVVVPTLLKMEDVFHKVQKVGGDELRVILNEVVKVVFYNILFIHIVLNRYVVDKCL